MGSQYGPQTPSERERESDRLLLEFAVKKCALTLSKVEILSLAERILTEASDRKVEAILSEYRRDPAQPPSAPPVPEEKTAFSAAFPTPAAVEGPPIVRPEMPAPAGLSPPPAESRDAPAKAPEAAGRSARDAGAAEKRGKKKKSFFGDLLFYGVLVALIVGVVLLTGSGEQGPRTFAGFTAQTVLTSSMEDVYPKGALVVSRYTDPETLEIGDDITFMSNETTTITHRIIGIVEDYAGTGQRAFQTQGVMNAAPDSQLVPAANVVGKVVFHSCAAGKAADFLSDYWPLLLFFLVILAVLTRVLKYIYRKDDGSPDGAGKTKEPRGKKTKKEICPSGGFLEMQ
ncbi:MAG TPA: signal peptidase I [Firmicutes bacterium]|nr:signal peptidase I [Bacillota bacterium]